MYIYTYTIMILILFWTTFVLTEKSYNKEIVMTFLNKKCTTNTIYFFELLINTYYAYLLPKYLPIECC